MHTSNNDISNETLRFQIDGRLRTLRALGTQVSVVDRLRALHRQAAEELGPDDVLTIEIEAGLAWEGTGHQPIEETMRAYHSLSARIGDRTPTPVYQAPLSVRHGSARALRRVGSPAAIQAYRDNVQAAQDLGTRRQLSTARLNLAIALRASRDANALPEAMRLTEAEVAWRTEKLGAQDRYSMSAQHELIRCRLELHRDGRPVVPLDTLLQDGHAHAGLRRRVLGGRHQYTLAAEITLAEILCAAGQVDDALWLLMGARARGFDVPTDQPELLPMVYAECCLTSEDPEDLIGALLFAQEAVEKASAVYGPHTVMAQRCRKTLADVEAAITEAGL